MEGLSTSDPNSRKEEAKTNDVHDDPYRTALAGHVPDCQKARIRLVVRAVLSNRIMGRDLKLMDVATRAIERGSIAEFIACERPSRPGDTVNDVAYLCFAEAKESGVLFVGDDIDFGVVTGTLAGFNDVHSPNHLNVVIHVGELATGRTRGLRPGTPVTVAARTFRERAVSPNEV
jgi:hypothetical protein